MARGSKTQLVVTVSGDTAQLNRALRDAGATVHTFAKKTDEHLGGMAARGQKHMHQMKVAALGAGGALAGGLVLGLKESFSAAVAAEKSQAALNQQLKSSGTSWKAHGKQIEEVFRKQSQLTGFTDNDLRKAFTSLDRSTGSVTGSLKLMSTTEDIARAKHMDLEKASILVAKAHDGNVGALKRMGISIDPVTKAVDKLRETNKHATVEQVNAAKAADKTSTAHKVLGEIQHRFSGQAEAYGKTAAGAQDRFRAATEHLEEVVGKKLLPVLTPLIEKASTFVSQMEDGTGAGGRFADKLKDVYNAIKPIVEFFIKHPKYIAVAIAAWSAYRLAAAAALAKTRLQALGLFGGLAEKAATSGAASGAAFGGRFKGATSKLGSLTANAMKAGPWALVAAGIAAGFVMIFDKKVRTWISNFATSPAPTPAQGLTDLIPGRKPGQVVGPHGWQDPAPNAPGKPTTGKHLPGVSRFVQAISMPNMDGGTYGFKAQAASSRTPIEVAYAALVAAGFRGKALRNMLAIAGRESSYNPHAKNLKYPDHSIGLWQINQLAQHGALGSDRQLQNPYANARAAKKLFDEAGYSPWKYGSGDWQGGISASVWAKVNRLVKHGGGGVTRPTYVNPIKGAHIGQADMGVDINMPSGAPIRALGDGVVLGVVENWYKGQPYMAYRLTSGPYKGHVVYVAEQIVPVVRHGAVKAGQTIATAAPSGTGIETGWADPKNWRNTLAQSHGHGSYAVRHAAGGTAEGRSFVSFLGNINAGKFGTTSGGGGSGGGVSAPRVTPFDRASAVLNTIGLEVSAGVISQATGDRLTAQTVGKALKGGFGRITNLDHRLELMGNRHDAKKDLASIRKAQLAKIKSAHSSRVVLNVKQGLVMVATLEKRGVYSHDAAMHARIVIVKGALDGDYGPLTADDRSWLKAKLAELRTTAASDAEGFVGTPFDDAALTEAQIATPGDSSDDLKVQQGRLWIATANYAAAVKKGDRAGIVKWGAIVQSAQSAITDLTGGASGTDSTASDLLAAMKDNTAALEAQNNYAAQATSVQTGVLWKALSDLVSGQITGVGYQGRAAMAGSGSVARY